MLDTKKGINELCNHICSNKKQDDGVQHEPKQQYLLCGGNIHIWVQDILEISVKFDGDTNNPNLQKVIASRNTQRREEQAVLSMVRCKATEYLSEASKVPLEHMFKINANCSVEWCFKTCVQEEPYLPQSNIFHCQQKQGSAMWVHQIRCSPTQERLGVNDKK